MKRRLRYEPQVGPVTYHGQYLDEKDFLKYGLFTAEVKDKKGKPARPIRMRVNLDEWGEGVSYRDVAMMMKEKARGRR